METFKENFDEIEFEITDEFSSEGLLVDRLLNGFKFDLLGVDYSETDFYSDMEKVLKIYDKFGPNSYEEETFLASILNLITFIEISNNSLMLDLRFVIIIESLKLSAMDFLHDVMYKRLNIKRYSFVRAMTLKDYYLKLFFIHKVNGEKEVFVENSSLRTALFYSNMALEGNLHKMFYPKR